MNRVGLLAVLGALLALTMSACSGSSTPSKAPATPSVTPDAAVVVPKAPKARACYRLTVKQLTQPTNDSVPVRCTRRHTARTIFVGRLDLVVDGPAIAVDSERVQEQLAKTCPAKLAAYLGGDPETLQLSRFRVAWFSPTLEEADRGARFYRCDLLAFGVEQKLFDLPRKVQLRGVLAAADGLDRFGLCGTDAPGAADFQRVICGLPHTWRAVSTIGLEGGKRYPGEDAVRDGGDSTCSDQVRELEGFALKITYGWEWPTRAQWKAGQHFGYCWAPTD